LVIAPYALFDRKNAKVLADFYGSRSLISVCLGMADLLFKAWLTHHECLEPLSQQFTSMCPEMLQ
jgi:hypothetical protein